MLQFIRFPFHLTILQKSIMMPIGFYLTHFEISTSFLEKWGVEISLESVTFDLDSLFNSVYLFA